MHQVPTINFTLLSIFNLLIVSFPMPRWVDDMFDTHWWVCNMCRLLPHYYSSAVLHMLYILLSSNVGSYVILFILFHLGFTFLALFSLTMEDKKGTKRARSPSKEGCPSPSNTKTPPRCCLGHHHHWGPCRRSPHAALTCRCSSRGSLR
jgi:hypothetical protein